MCYSGSDSVLKRVVCVEVVACVEVVVYVNW